MTIPHLTDVHTHYDEAVFDGCRRETLLRMREKGLCAIINSGSDLPSSRRSLTLAEEYDFIWASVGVFPLCAAAAPQGWLAEIEAMAAHPRAVAIGEIGLDYRLPETDKAAQKAVFLPQLELAQRLDMPVVIHDCLADEDVLAALEQYPARAMIHRFFSGLEYGRRFLEKGVFLGIGPAITYPDAGELIQLVREMPLSLLLLETDCPFLPPCRLEGETATSDMLEDVVQAVAQARGDVTPQQVADIARENAMRLFSISC
ncbi:TatD family hydrolase [Anaerofilum sp. BX8]|uniref:TatD family hydrolase n=1 Tax=Anaerofilum hominis TaxID=2763016 RepID=A0A923I934_9FIRM|nr:TatD family hydrolase [Anaerofilum hominis]MBC5582124.1 TatD family hydrolase [Anaerofilum hominis]